MIILLNNICCVIFNKCSSSRYTEKGKARIAFYKKKSLLISISLIFVLTFIILYTKSLSFYEVLKISHDKKIDSISLYGNISGPQIKDLDVGDSNKIISLLNNYKYKRTFAFENIEGEAEFLIINNEFIEIKEGGYLRMLNNRVYKVQMKKNQNLYDALKSEVNNMGINE